MRISDWSPDVCSSDLIRRHIDDSAGGEFGRIAGEGKAVAVAGDQLVELRIDHRHPAGGKIGNQPVVLVEADHAEAALRSVERRDGKEGVSTCRSGWSAYH